MGQEPPLPAGPPGPTGGRPPADDAAGHGAAAALASPAARATVTGPEPAPRPAAQPASASAAEDTLARLRQACVAAPADQLARATYAQCLLREGVAAAKAHDKERARGYLRELSRLTPGDERVWLWRATVAQGYLEANECLTRVLALAPEHPQALAAMAKLRERAAARTAPAAATAAAPAASARIAPAPIAPVPVPVPGPAPSGSAAAPAAAVPAVASAVGPTTAPPSTAAAPAAASPVAPPPGEPAAARPWAAPRPTPGPAEATPRVTAPTDTAPSGRPRTAEISVPAGPRDLVAPVVAAARSPEGRPGEPAPRVQGFVRPPTSPAMRFAPPDAPPAAAPPARPAEPATPGSVLRLFDAPVPATASQAPAPPAQRSRPTGATPIGFRPPAAEPPAPLFPPRAAPRTGERPALAPSVEAPPVAPPVAGPDAPPARGLVLVVDDSPTVLKVVEFELRKHRLDVLTAVDGADALARLREVTPDLVLLDINMPLMDGYQVCREIRGDPRTSRVPVVMLSGKDGFFDKIRGRLAGAAGYITKPFDAPALMDMLEKHFPVRR